MAAALPSTRLAPPAVRGPAAWAAVGAGCLVLALLSLLVARQTTYDPTAWLIWGREIIHGDLSTTRGPSWKPLPALVTVPSALLADPAQQQIWLVVARGGALAAAALAWRLAWRLEGHVAGAIAAAALLLSSAYASQTFRGDSEGVLAALALGAVEAHLFGRRGLAFALLIATALVRPEMLLFAGLYALWLLVAARPGRDRLRIAAVTGAAGVAVVAAWLIPEKIGSGHLLRAASRALEPVAGSPAGAAHPFLATFTNAAPVLPWPVYAAGIAFVALQLRDLRRGRPEARLAIVLAAFATGVMVVVAAMTQMGFTGNPRYLTVPIALTGVLGGAGFVRLARLAWERLGRRAGTVAVVIMAAVAAPFAATAVASTRHQMHGAMHESERFAALPAAIAAAGGPARVLSCGAVIANPYDTQAVARLLHVHQSRVGIHATVPGTVVARYYSYLAHAHRFPHRTRTRLWVIASSCAR